MSLFTRSILVTGLLAGLASVAYGQYTYTTIDAPGAAPDQLIGGAYGGTYPLAINNAGVIVGYYVDSTDGYHGFIYSGGTFTTIDYSGCVGTVGTELTGINNYGVIVGHCGIFNEGFVDQNGTFTVINPAPALTSFSINGINDAGQMVGFGGGRLRIMLPTAARSTGMPMGTSRC